MKEKMKTKVLAILMSLAMAFTMMPMLGAPAYADDPAPAAPGIALGPDVLSIGSNTSGAATVYCGTTAENPVAWRVIGYKGDGVASTRKDPEKPDSADTMTLIAADNLNAEVQFRADWQAADANHYGKSNLKSESDKLTGTGTEKIFSDEEKAGIVPRDLEPEGYISTWPYTNGIAGDKVEDALLWPLSTQEAYCMDSGLRKANNFWWLRSPGSDSRYAARVSGDGDVSAVGNRVDGNRGVRPAFNYDLKSVIFTSAAVGGKSSGDVGAGSLKSVEPDSSNERKLTLESGHDNFKIEDVATCDGKTVTIKYSGAAAKKGEYISAIITDEKDAVKYYGNLIEFADGDSTSGTAKVTIDGKMEPTDKLYIFNEQLNGDKKTDYSSALNEIPIPAAGHVWKFGGFTWTGDEKNGYTEAIANYECANDTEHKSTVEAEIIGITEVSHPTCTENGRTKYIAAVASGESLDRLSHLKSAYADLPKATGHKWDAGKVTKKATTTATGIKTHTCITCKATKNVTLPKLAKKANPLSIKAKTVTVKGSTKGKNGKLKKTRTLSVSKVIAFTKKGQGKMTYTKASGNRKITINRTTGKVTVKKGLKKGTYRIKVKVKAAGNANYDPSAWKTVTFRIKVK